MSKSAFHEFPAALYPLNPPLTISPIPQLPLSYAIILAEYYSVSLDYLVGISDIKK